LPRYEKKLPVILSPAEVQRLLAAPKNLSHRTILTTMYAAGPRVSEVARLKASDIDSDRGVIWVRGGKGRKDRLHLANTRLRSITSPLERLDPLDIAQAARAYQPEE
jgi:site-specific recombinase XerD